MNCKDPFKNCDDFECLKNGCQSDVKPKPSIEIGHLNDDDFLVVHEVKEHEDGSATVQLDLGANAMRTLLQVGFIAIIKQGIRNAGEEE